MNANDTDASATNRLFSVPAVCELLDVKRDVVFGLVQRGELGSVRIGRRRLVSARQLDDFIAGLEAIGGQE